MNLASLAKLRGRGAAELRGRCAQALHACAERYGWTAGSHEPSDVDFLALCLDPALPASARSAAALLAAFRGGARPAFFRGVEDGDATVAELRARWPDAADALLAAADRIVAGEMDLLGHRGLRFGTPPDWHLDPTMRVRAPRRHWSGIDYLNPSVAGDHKVVWEFNRHHHLVTLGRAYRLSGDERYADVFAEQLAHWMDANPPKTGVNWASSLELAFRSIAWCWALHLFRPSPALTPALYLRTLKFLQLQAGHVERHLSTWFSPNTHLTGEALGLAYVGALFPELREAARWRALGADTLAGEMTRQVHPDGVYFEQSTWYQRYTADFCLHVCALPALGAADARVTGALERLLDHLMCVTRPDGTTPLVGDDDGGRLLPLDGRAPDDFRATLATGAALLGRADYLHVAGGPAEETLWLLGADGLGRLDALVPRAPANGSRAFPDGGVYVMRDGWGPNANWLRVGCGPHGALSCGHSHADALAIDVAARGRTLLVDPGTFTYTGWPEARDRFRGTAAHNTVTVDGESSSLPGTAFGWRSRARGTALQWIVRDRFDLFEGEHDGYLRLDDPVVHRRGILFLKGDYWIVRDRVDARGPHDAELRLQFALGTAVFPGPHGAALPDADVAVLGRGVQVRLHMAGVSRAYGELSPAPACSATAPAPGAFTTFILPRAGAGARPRVDSEPSATGEVMRVACAAYDDTVAFAVDGRVEGGGVESDCDWVWVRRDARFGAPMEYVVAGGSRLRVDGVELFRADGPVGFASARMNGGVMHVDTDARVPFDAVPLWTAPEAPGTEAG